MTPGDYMRVNMEKNLVRIPKTFFTVRTLVARTPTQSKLSAYDTTPHLARRQKWNSHRNEHPTD